MDNADGRPPAHRGDDERAAGGPGRGRLRAALRLAEVRLRLPMALIVAAVVVGRWDAMRNHWDRWTRAATPESISGHAVSSDTEYFCPMDPGVLSDWPGRCGVCNMALVRRKKGEARLLPGGVVARMQLSPYRVQLAGIRTATPEFLPLAREWSASGFVAREGDSARIEVEVPPGRAPWIAEGSGARVTCDDLPGLTMAGRVRSVAGAGREADGCRVATVTVDRPPRELRSGLIAAVRCEVPVADPEPYCSMPRNPPPLGPGEPRRLYVCADHDDSTSIRPGRCPLDDRERDPRPLGDTDRIRWWCPMHPAVTSARPGARCAECGGMELRPRVVVYAPAGRVLAVPQSAVVDTGERKVVFVEEMPGMFDGVEVELGPRCGDYYPVTRGVEPGHRVAVAGAFLLDAETRLNPGLAAGYFGASGTRRESAAPGLEPAAAPPPATVGLGPEDRALADRQKDCPVTGLALGSMGTPVRLEVSGRVVFLCCGGCRSKLLADPGKYLARLRAP